MDPTMQILDTKLVVKLGFLDLSREIRQRVDSLAQDLRTRDMEQRERLREQIDRLGAEIRNLRQEVSSLRREVG